MDQQQLITYFTNNLVFTTRIHYGTFSAMTCLFFDIVITLDEEIRLIWRSKWSLPKVLYLINRYITCILFIILLYMQRTEFPLNSNTYDFFPVVSNCHNRLKSYHSCVILSIFVACTEHLVIIALEIVLMIRIFALYQGNRIVLLLLCVAFLVSSDDLSTPVAKTGINTYFLIEVITKTHWISLRLTGFLPGTVPAQGCIGLKPPHGAYNGYWYLTLALEAMLFLLTFLNILHHWRASRSFRVLRKARLMNIFLRDGTLFFAAVLAVLVYNTLTFNVEIAEENITFIIFNYSIFSVAGARIILSLRSESLRMRNKSHLNGTTVEMSSMHFAAGAGVAVVTMARTGFNGIGTMDEMLVESIVYRDVNASGGAGAGLGAVNALDEDEVMEDGDGDEVLEGSEEDVDVDHPRGDWLADWRTEFDPRSSLILPVA